MRLPASLMLLIALCLGCSTHQSKTETTKASGPGTGQNAERSIASIYKEALPWEVLGDNGETYLSNVYYAENSETEQIMPMVMDNGRFQIDRLIYPTIGNPNLYIKTSPARLVFVLRLENENLHRLGLDHYQSSGSPLFDTPIPAVIEAWKNSLAFYLISRGERSRDDKDNIVGSSPGTYRIWPSQILIDKTTPSMPDEFKKRTTVRIYFHKPSMDNIPEGLYDTRFEAIQNDKIISDNVTHETVREFQYNAVRVFNQGPDANGGKYTILNVSDTQGSVGTIYQALTMKKLKDFVHYVNLAIDKKSDPHVARAAFISFNGDLHNGGSPLSIYSSTVSTTYNNEAKEIISTLKELELPIFLTTGNHDGYVSIGSVPRPIFDNENFWSLPNNVGRKIDIPTHAPLTTLVGEALKTGKSTWPGMTVEAFSRWSGRTGLSQNNPNFVPPGGKHVNITVGSHIRLETSENASLDQAWSEGWKPVNINDRNIILYDGFNQWQRTYGPLYFSWTFGKNHFVSLNSFELRQHRRSGWGMYTVNYGGWVSPVQLKWAERELDRAQDFGNDVILLAHHDPRGGHNGEDFPYYFRQLDFYGMTQSFFNYIKSDKINPLLCKDIPKDDRGNKLESECLHDGLQEWMRADAEFDCEPKYFIPGDPQYHCNTNAFNKPGSLDHPWYSGFWLVDLISGRDDSGHRIHTNLRTMILGHTHYNSLQMLQEGDHLIPKHLEPDAETIKRFTLLEQQDPLRNISKVSKGSDPADTQEGFDRSALELMTQSQMAQPQTTEGIKNSATNFILHLNKEAGYAFKRSVHGEAGTKRELAVIRVTSNAKLTSQRFRVDGKNDPAMFGFTVFDFWPVYDSRNYALPQINGVTWYRSLENGFFKTAGKSVILNRTARYAAGKPSNPHGKHPEVDSVEGNEAYKRFYRK